MRHGIPVGELTEDEGERLFKMEEALTTPGTAIRKRAAFCWLTMQRRV
jgi:hypothetical protein